MKRICKLIVGDRIMYQWKWWTVDKITEEKIHLTEIRLDGLNLQKLKRKIPAKSQEFVQFEATA
jgi:hypothetical protein